jgi:hypothetical protein
MSRIQERQQEKPMKNLYLGLKQKQTICILIEQQRVGFVNCLNYDSDTIQSMRINVRENRWYNQEWSRATK